MRLVTGPAGKVLLFVLCTCAALSLWSLRGLTFDHNTHSLLRADEEEDAREAELVRVFGSEDLLLVAWSADALDTAEFRRVGEVTRALAAIEGLEEVYSIASARAPVSIGGELRPLDEKDLQTEAGRAAARKALLASPVYRGTIYSDKLDVVAVASTVKLEERTRREATLRAVQAVARRFERPDRPIHVAGVTALAVDAAAYAVEDMQRIGLLALLVSIAVLFVLCGSVAETCVAVAATALPPLFALGLATTMDLPLTALSAALFPVLAVVGITTSVHLLNAYTEEQAGGRSAASAAVCAMRRVRAPILLSLGTTAAAFYSLTLTGVPAFRAGGAVVALGVLMAIPVVLWGLPAALSWIRPPLRTRRSRLVRPLLATGVWALRHRRLIVIAGIALFAGGVVLAVRAPVQVDVLQAFAKKSRIARTYRFLEERLTATLPTDLVLQARPDATEAQILDDLRRFTTAVLKEPGVTSALSVATLVEYGKAIRPVDDKGALWVLRSFFGPITRRFEDPGSRRYRVKMRIREGASPDVLDRLEARAREFETGEARFTGLFVRAVSTTRLLLRNVAWGALFMTILVGVTVALALNSWRLGVAALLPNALPPVLVFAGASVAGFALDISAVAVAAVAVGLAVDDSLHVLFRTANECGRGRGVAGALLRTQRSVGRALVLSSIVLGSGLGCLLLSNFLPTLRFGLLTAVSCGIALVADLLLLPALVRVLLK